MLRLTPAEAKEGDSTDQQAVCKFGTLLQRVPESELTIRTSSLCSSFTSSSWRHVRPTSDANNPTRVDYFQLSFNNLKLSLTTREFLLSNELPNPFF